LSDERPSDVLGALPRRRPHRRSEKRPTPAPSAGHTDGTPAPAAAAATKRSGTRTAATKRGSGTRPRGAQPANGARPANGGRPAKNSARKAPTSRTAPATAAAPATRSAQPRRQGEPLRQPAQPGGTPPAPSHRGSRERSTSRDIIGVAAQAAAELAEIGLSVSARALRNAVGRLPRP